jgi:hypothetical protein
MGNIGYNEMKCRMFISYVPVPVALRGHGRVAGSVGTVVIYGILLANPLESPVLPPIKVLEILLVPPPHPLCNINKIKFSNNSLIINIIILVSDNHFQFVYLARSNQTPLHTNT